MKFCLIILAILISLCTAGQNVYDVKVLKQQDMAAWDVPGANYSGITYLGNNRYALVSDKEKTDGFYLFTILLDSISGKVTDIKAHPINGVTSSDNSLSPRDQEGIAYNPYENTVLISGEGDQRIIEYSTSGIPTGRELSVPSELSINAIFPNYGFEALTFSVIDSLYWTVTEHTLQSDGQMSNDNNPQPCMLRLQSFSADMKASKQYIYRTEAPINSKSSKKHVFGVAALTALSDGSLLVLEREFFVAPKYIGSWVQNRIFHVRPASARSVTFDTDISDISLLNDSDFLDKDLVAEFKTSLNLAARSLANYEGMCLGPILPDGRHTLILVSDAQGNYGNSMYRMKDFIRVITFRYTNID